MTTKNGETPMPTRGYSHVAIGVSDMEAAIEFYRDVAGLTMSRDSRENFEARGDLPRHTRRGVYFRWDHGTSESFLVLDHHDRDAKPDPLQLFQLGMHHFAFWVDDVDEIFGRAQRKGANILVPPTDTDTDDYAEPAGGTIRALLLKDPDGNIVQFDQRMTD